jgi:hypothetical protein
MVQIRRQHLQQRTSSFFGSILALIRFLLLSAVIPSLFVLRHYWFGWTAPDIDGAPHVALLPTAATTVIEREGTGGVNPTPNLRSPGSATAATATEQSQSSPPSLPQSPPSLPLHLEHFLQSLLVPISTTHADVTDTDGGNTNTHDNTMLHRYSYSDSDLVELDHCNIAAILNDPTSLIYHNFTVWSYPLLNATVSDLVRGEHASLFAAHDAAAILATNTAATGIVTDANTDTDGSATTAESSESTSSSITAPKVPALSLMERVQREFLLELLEMYATASGLCDFSRYKPTVPFASASSTAATTTKTKTTTPMSQ